MKNAQEQIESERGHLGGMPPVYDQHYVSDLSDDGLENAYRLLHSEAGKNVIRESDPEMSTLLKAELTMRREFQLRELVLPEFPEADILKRMFESVGKMSMADEEDALEKADANTKYNGTTVEDANDGHTHTYSNLDRFGNGVTDEGGDSKHLHSHNVSKFVTLPIQLSNGYISDHPGKVNLKTSKGEFKVTKRFNGFFEWEAEIELVKVDVEKRLVGGIVYEPDIVDAQGDSSSDTEIEKACHNYMIKSMTVGKMHTEKIPKEQVALVENYIAPGNFFIGQEFVRKGSWVQVHKVLDDKLWQEIKDGKYTGLSMAGRAKDISPKNREGSVFGKSASGVKNMDTRAQVMANASDAAKGLDAYIQHMEAGRTDEAEEALKEVQGALQDSANRMKLGNDHTAQRMLGQAGNSFTRQSVGMKSDKPMHLSDAHYALKDAHRSLVDHALRLKKNSETMNELHGGRLGGLISLLKMDIEKMIKKIDGKYYVYTKDGSRKLGGPFDDREKAFKMLAAVEANKHLTAKHLVSSEIKMGKANIQEAPLVEGVPMVHRNVLALHGFMDSPEYQVTPEDAVKYMHPNGSWAEIQNNMTTFTWTGGQSNSKKFVKSGPHKTGAALNLALKKAKKLVAPTPKPSQGPKGKPGFAGTMMMGSRVKGGKK
jgi:hypothetical protein